MDKTLALSALAALGQETRLDIFRLLVKAGEGVPAGAVATRRKPQLTGSCKVIVP